MTTPLRLAPSTADVLARQLGDGAADEVAARLGDLGEGEVSAAVVREASVYLSVRWYAHGSTWANWWIACRDSRGALVIGGPTGDPARG